MLREITLHLAPNLAPADFAARVSPGAQYTKLRGLRVPPDMFPQKEGVGLSIP